MTKYIFLAIFILHSSASAVEFKPICPPYEVLNAFDDSQIPEHFRFQEQEFVFENAMEKHEFINHLVYEELDRVRGVDIWQLHQFYLGYPNSERIVKGTLLRQKVLLEMNNPQDDGQSLREF